MRFGFPLQKPTLITLLILMGLSANAMAQEVYFSISGKSTTVSSGDRLGQYDYWLRPAPGVDIPRPATVEIFDAGLGGFADVIAGQPNTRTTYSLHTFRNLYEKGTREIRRSATSGRFQPLDQQTTFTESRFLNRWVPFFTLQEQEASTEGFIMRVETDEGNDVNDFRIRITGDGASDWELITLNLSVGLISSAPENRFQFRPLWDDAPPPVFSLSGQEDSRIFLMDAFGNTNAHDRNWREWEPEQYGLPNSWAVVMTGSAVRINNRVLAGQDAIIPFRTDFVTLNEDRIEAPQVEIQTFSGQCQQYGLRANYRGFVLNMQQAEWRTDGQRFAGSSFSHEFSAFGLTPWTLIVPVEGRHVPRHFVKEGQLNVNAPPVIQVEGYREMLSPGEALVLDASSSFNPDGGSFSYRWFVNGEPRGSSSSFRFQSSVSGAYDIRLRLTDSARNASCTETTEDFPVIVNTQPYAEIDFNRVIAKDVPNTIAAFRDFDPDGNELAFRWEGPGIVSTAEGREIQVQHAQAGTFRIQLTADDQTGTQNATYTTTVEYKVNAAPVPSFAVPSIEAPGETIALDASASFDPDGDPLTYIWEISDGRELSGERQNISFTQPGLYTITLLANDGEGVENSVQQISRDIRINRAPVPDIAATDFTNQAIVDFDASASIDADQGIVSWEWDFGDGQTASGERVTHAYQAYGTYTVRLTVDDGQNVSNSRQYTEHTVTINSNPVAVMDFPTVVAPGDEIPLDGSQSFDPDGEVTAWQWTVNNQSAGEGERSSGRIDTPGVFEVNLQVRDDSPFDDATSTTSGLIRVNHPPVPVWENSPRVTEPNRPTTFDASGSFDPDNDQLSYRWEFSDGEVFEGEQITRTFPASGTAFFTLYADDGEGLANSVSSVEGSVRINMEPIIITETDIMSNSLQVELNASESYNPDGGTLTYLWILPDGSEQRQAQFTWTAPEPGIHTLSLQVDDGEGLENSVSTERITVTVNRPPVAVIDERIDGCTDQLIVFSGARSFDPDGDSFTTRWEFGDGNSSNEINPVHSYRRPGTYTARVFLNDGIAAEPTIAELPVVIEGSPQAQINFDEITVCANSPITFDGTESTDPNGIVASYNWDFGDMNSAVGSRTTHLYTRPGTYRVSLTITGSGTGTCPNMSQQTAIVNVVAAPEAVFEIPSVVSPGTAVTLDAGNSVTEDQITSVAWRITSESDEQFEPIERSGMLQEISLDQPGSYIAELTINTDNDAGCASNTITRRIVVNQAPEVVWNTPEIWMKNKPFLLSAEGSRDADGFITNYTWTIDGEPFAESLSARLPVQEFGSFEIGLEVTDNAGVENSTVQKTQRLTINPSPVPQFELPAYLWLGETLELNPAENRDPASNPVYSSWRINGELFDEQEVRIETDRPDYLITLIQDDRLGLENSVATVTRTFRVRMPEELTVRIPAGIIAGSSLDRSITGLRQPYVFMESDQPSETWQAPDISGSAGASEIADFRIGWQPRNQVLHTESRQIEVFAPLQAAQSEVRETVAFNPVNNTALVTAPAVNRPSAHGLRYEWRLRGTNDVITRGRSIHLPIMQGDNLFDLVITETDAIIGKSELIVPVHIIAE
ncbi:PKD repeat-containing protein [Cyclonatronum proteinivorum]|uniref:PKD repeat-containing protein n=1 Tax=Cyclonatronum proteinivorum TaxID=1457365 RepID=A0A345UMS2_9BACT|nr:PKD domain-containing protein [Cyclonatronum proteinivorum]AXJ01774.1 PKD repeat-containing protein [Cyclonatronum proteinivorum]